MADEQTPQSDVIGDAIRDVEQQLEQKLAALKMSALGDANAPAPAGAAPVGSGEWGQAQPTEQWSEPQAEVPAQWSEPAPEAEWTPEATEPQWDDEQPATGDHTQWAEPAAQQWEQPVAGGSETWQDDAIVEPVGAAPAADSWSDAVLRPVEPTGPAGSGGFVPDDGQPGYDAPQQTWTEPAQPYGGGFQAPTGHEPTGGFEPAYGSQPTEEEVQFWAQTRTALRLLQQSSDNLTQQVSGVVTDQVEQIVRDELAAPNTALRQLQQALPRELEAPTEAIRQLQEELPVQLNRLERTVQDLVQRDIAHVEQSIAENVIRLANDVTGHVGKTDRNMTENIERVERNLRTQFERIEHSMRTELDRVEHVMRDELEAPNAGVRQLQEELPTQFQRIERVMRDQDHSVVLDRLSGSVNDLATSFNTAMRDEIVPSRRQVDSLVRLDLGGVLGDVVQASRLTLDKLGNVADELDRDRLQRVEDLELMIDSMTTGWQGLYGAVNKLFDKVETFDQRMIGVERQLAALGQLEQTVDTALGSISSQLQSNLGSMQQHLQELQPAPVIVTVNHPQAEVSQSTRAGYISPPATDS